LGTARPSPETLVLDLVLYYFDFDSPPLSPFSCSVDCKLLQFRRCSSVGCFEMVCAVVLFSSSLAPTFVTVSYSRFSLTKTLLFSSQFLRRSLLLKHHPYHFCICQRKLEARFFFSLLLRHVSPEDCIPSLPHWMKTPLPPIPAQFVLPPSPFPAFFTHSSPQSFYPLLRTDPGWSETTRFFKCLLFCVFCVGF